MTIGMFNSFITRHWFCQEAKRIWSDTATLQAWLDVEAALAWAQAECGLIPRDAAVSIAAHADARLFDLDDLAAGISWAQHPLMPVLHRFEALCGHEAGGFIHWGATTQNIFDTATAVQMRPTHDLIIASLQRALLAMQRLALAHASTPMAGRTHGQHALPMTFGFKLAGWMCELSRHVARLQERLAPSFPASMGGAIGTYAAMGSDGPRVEAALARRLGLQPAGLPSRASYDRAADYISTLGLLAGTTQKIAQDIIFLQRTEVGEVAEAFHLGKVGSSTMAQKRNPSTALLLTSLSRMLRARVPLAVEAMVRMDEGDSSATNVTDAALPEMAVLAASVAETLARLADGLQVHPDAMRHNLGLTAGLITSEAAMMQLAGLIGRPEAHRVLYEAVQRAHTRGEDFIDCILGHPLLAGLTLPDGLARALEPGNYLGLSETLTYLTAQAMQPTSPDDASPG